MKYTCPKCYAKVDGMRRYCDLDQNEYIHLEGHTDLKGNQCSPYPYNLITGQRRPMRGADGSLIH